MIPISAAITKGAALAPNSATTYFDFASYPHPASDPLGAAYLGSIHPGAVEAFFEHVRSITKDNLCTFMLHNLHRAFPQLGSSVRAWPRMVEELERDRLIPRIRTNQPAYRAEVHISLWKVICDMHAAGESKEQIAEFLGRHGL